MNSSTYAVELPLDDDFEVRAHAARRLWRALNGRAPGPPFHDFPHTATATGAGPSRTRCANGRQ